MAEHGQTIAALERIADVCVVLATAEPFAPVSRSYARFEHVSDERIRGLLRGAAPRPLAAASRA